MRLNKSIVYQHDSKQIEKPDNSNCKHHINHESEEKFSFGVAVNISQVKCWKNGVMKTDLIGKKVGAEVGEKHQ